MDFTRTALVQYVPYPHKVIRMRFNISEGTSQHTDFNGKSLFFSKESVIQNMCYWEIKRLHWTESSFTAASSVFEGVFLTVCSRGICLCVSLIWVVVFMQSISNFGQYLFVPLKFWNVMRLKGLTQTSGLKSSKWWWEEVRKLFGVVNRQVVREGGKTRSGKGQQRSGWGRQKKL